MLLTKVLHQIFVQFCVNFRPSVPPKSRFSLERVADFEVFRMFLPSTLFITFSFQFWTLWVSFWELWGPFWAPFDASWGVLRSLLTPSSTLLPQKPVLKALLILKTPQESPKSTKINPNRTPLLLIWSSTIEKIHENQWKSTKINEESTIISKINQNPPKSTKINENHW